MFGPPKKDAKKAAKELKSSLMLFGTLIVAVRAIPYMLHFYQKATAPAVSE
jgi:hypothetical protein